MAANDVSIDPSPDRRRIASMDDWRIGDIRVTRILEMCDPLRTPTEWFPDCTDEALEPHLHWLTPRSISPATSRIILPIQSFLVRTGRHTILVDGCVGNDKTIADFPHWHRRNDGTFLERLANAGVAPDEIDYVLCTHLHVDHCGWNTRLVDGRLDTDIPQRPLHHGAARVRGCTGGFRRCHTDL
ncbi:MAG: MBL fold metallo-hydrolase [Mesorhizobium sp.]|nr:MAG: MBL fold metallo-hydrolase [Mesorhizobium sp.]